MPPSVYPTLNARWSYLDKTKVQWYAPYLGDILCCQIDFTVP
jgi:hypothetical protein